MDRRFPREARLRRSADFESVFGRRQAAADDVLLVFAAENTLARTRLGLSVSKKVGGAVTRNRWKRALREAFRHVRQLLPPGLDLVVVPKVGQPCASADLTERVRRLATRAHKRLQRAKRPNDV